MVFTDWGGTKTYVDDEEVGFNKLWNNQAKHCLIVDVPTAIRDKLLTFNSIRTNLDITLNP